MTRRIPARIRRMIAAYAAGGPELRAALEAGRNRRTGMPPTGMTYESHLEGKRLFNGDGGMSDPVIRAIRDELYRIDTGQEPPKVGDRLSDRPMPDGTWLSNWEALAACGAVYLGNALSLATRQDLTLAWRKAGLELPEGWDS